MTRLRTTLRRALGREQRDYFYCERNPMRATEIDAAMRRHPAGKGRVAA